MKKFLCAAMAALMLMSGMTAMADETSAIRLEGEHFDLTVGGVATELTSGVIQSAWEGQSNGKGLYVNTAEVPEALAEFYVPEEGMYTMKYVTNVYASESTKGWQSQYKFTVNGTEFDGSLASKLSEDPLTTGTEGVYEITIPLSKGHNSVKLTSTTIKTNDNKYLLYLDYVEFTKSNGVLVECENLSVFNSKRTKAELSGGVAGVYTSTTNNECEITVNAPMAGYYSVEWCAQKHDFSGDWMSKWDVYINDTLIDVADLQFTTSAADGNYRDYKTGAVLNQGANTIKFVMQFQTYHNRYDLYCDYIRLVKAEEPEKSGKIVIEGESYSASEGIAATGSVYDSYEYGDLAPSTDTKHSTTLMSGGQITYFNTTAIPGSLTYKANVDISGNYDMSFDMFAQLANETWVSPMSVTVKQAENVLVDDVILSSDGTYVVYTVEEGDTIQSNEVCDITTDEGTPLYKTQYNNPFKRYSYLDQLALAEGEVEVTLKAVAVRSTDGINADTKGYFGIDAINLVREKDYSEVKIKSATDETTVGKKVQLTAADKYNSIIGADEAEISWTSSNENIAAVDANGLVTAKNPGVTNITLTVAYEGGTATVTKEITVTTEAEKFIIKSVSLEGNDVVVKYASMANLDVEDVTLIAGRFPAANAALSEVKDVKLSGNAPYMYRTERITLDDTTGKIKLFTWTNLTELVPVFSAIEVQ